MIDELFGALAGIERAWHERDLVSAIEMAGGGIALLSERRGFPDAGRAGQPQSAIICEPEAQQGRSFAQPEPGAEVRWRMDQAFDALAAWKVALEVGNDAEALPLAEAVLASWLALHAALRADAGVVALAWDVARAAQIRRTVAGEPRPLESGRPLPQPDRIPEGKCSKGEAQMGLEQVDRQVGALEAEAAELLRPGALPFDRLLTQSTVHRWKALGDLRQRVREMYRGPWLRNPDRAHGRALLRRLDDLNTRISAALPQPATTPLG